jgi:hypothetical protein
LSIVTGVRATSPALAIAKAAFRSSQTVVATVMVVAVIAFLPLPLALWWASARSAELASEDVTAEHNAPAD